MSNVVTIEIVKLLCYGGVFKWLLKFLMNVSVAEHVQQVVRAMLLQREVLILKSTLKSVAVAEHVQQVVR